MPRSFVSEAVFTICWAISFVLNIVSGCVPYLMFNLTLQPIKKKDGVLEVLFKIVDHISEAEDLNQEMILLV